MKYDKPNDDWIHKSFLKPVRNEKAHNRKIIYLKKKNKKNKNKHRKTWEE